AHKKTAPCELEGMSNFWGAVQTGKLVFRQPLSFLYHFVTLINLYRFLMKFGREWEISLQTTQTD
ncbi:hypothetical protein, partial [Neisseria mucosa]|uniref:hypothetical protein n=1 Tax=Neisseria mucosa TaxID=488 RepID=UPI001981012D